MLGECMRYIRSSVLLFFFALKVFLLCCSQFLPLIYMQIFCRVNHEDCTFRVFLSISLSLSLFLYLSLSNSLCQEVNKIVIVLLIKEVKMLLIWFINLGLLAKNYDAVPISDEQSEKTIFYLNKSH